jgi:flagellar biosynthesis protein FlhG
MNVQRTERQATVIAVTSGKGGVGKTNLSINMAVALARLRHRVAIIDADYALGNVDVMLGLAPDAHVAHLLSGEKRLRDVLVEGPCGLQVLPAGSGVQPLAALDETQRDRFAAAIGRFAGRYADQNERDHAQLARAVADGTVESAPG